MRVRSDAVTICPPPPPPCHPRTRHMSLAADATLDATTEEHSLPASDGGAAAGDGAAHEMAARPPAAFQVTRWWRGRRRWWGSRDGGAAAGVGVAHEIAAPNGTLRAPVVEAAAAGRVGATTATSPTHPLPCSDSAVIAAFAPLRCARRPPWRRGPCGQPRHVDIGAVAADVDDGGGGGGGGGGGDTNAYGGGDGSYAATRPLGGAAAAVGSPQCRACAQSSSSVGSPRGVAPPPLDNGAAASHCRRARCSDRYMDHARPSPRAGAAVVWGGHPPSNGPAVGGVAPD